MLVISDSLVVGEGERFGPLTILCVQHTGCGARSFWLLRELIKLLSGKWSLETHRQPWQGTCCFLCGSCEGRDRKKPQWLLSPNLPVMTSATASSLFHPNLLLLHFVFVFFELLFIPGWSGSDSIDWAGLRFVTILQLLFLKCLKLWVCNFNYCTHHTSHNICKLQKS